LSLPPDATFPDRELIASTLLIILLRICVADIEGFCDFKSAATPDTWGVAIDVPLRYW
jgi:hypothetical protein